MTRLEFHRPDTLKEALEILEKFPGSRIVAGGTDLIVLMKDLLVKPSALVSLSRVKEFSRIDFNADGLHLGPMTPLWRMEKHDRIKGTFPALFQAVISLAVPPIRNQATVGGNLCLDTKCIYYNQSRVWKRALTTCFKGGGKICHVAPSGKRCLGGLVAETAGPFSIYNAVLTIASPRNVRTLPIEDFFSGDGIKPNTLAPGEVVAGIRIPLPPSGAGAAYYRFSTRKALEFSRVNLTGAICLDERGRISSARLLVGAIGPAPVEVRKSLVPLIGQVPSEKLWSETAKGVAGEAVRLSRSPRLTPHLQAVVTVNTERIFQQAWREATGNSA